MQVIKIEEKPDCLLHQDETIYYKEKYIKEHFSDKRNEEFGLFLQTLYREVLINQ